ncbi:MAG: cold shock domain-containing protein [Anaerolineae bacterium]
MAPPPGRRRGLVKWFSRSKGYGFITAVTGEEVFVHKSGLSADTPTLRAGQLVEFAVAHTPRGVQAAQVVALM